MLEVTFVCQTYVYLAHDAEICMAQNDMDEADTIHGKLQHFTYITVITFALIHASFIR